MLAIRSCKLINLIGSKHLISHVGKVESICQIYQGKYNINQITSRYASSSEPLQTDKLELKIDNSVVKRLRKVLEEDQFLRVFVEGGGCSGYQYKFEIDNCFDKDDDITFIKGGVKVVSDEGSLKILNGSTVDFHEDMLRAGFRIVGIPQAEKGCSCGVSFSVKL